MYPPDKSKNEIDEANNSDFKKSEDSAAYAALSFLKYPVAVTVQSVTDPGPSAGKLHDGDAIDGVNGTPVANLDEFQAILKKTKPGDQLVIDFRRKNAPPGVATITLGDNPDRDYGFLGVGVLDAPWAPFDIDFNLANIGGPSAGLMFSLAVVDKLTTGDLNDGKFIAGTGTITGDGKVGSIGGITHKMLAAKRGRGDRVPGARRQLHRGALGTPGRHGSGEGRHADSGGRRVAHDFCRWRTTSLLDRTRPADG